MLDGRADADLGQRTRQFGVNNYCVKSSTVQMLREKIEDVFGRLT
ncbi:MAG: two-component system, chemotaxis family, response regulator CheY [Alphaproteobacteria bacterium]|nr:MAG: two-component system chemotaxis family response regulator CheY [Caulobacteraceae bacterium]TPW08785.1 MAG: two-component system, chemotaxis family, response regulator CheY [Alphaproteobacteria bacterium]